MSHNIFVLNFWSIVDKKVLPVSGATWTRSSQTSSLRVKVIRDGKEKNSAPSLGSQFLLRPRKERGPPTHIINAAMKYYDKTQFGRDRTPGDPQRFHNVNSLVWRCGAAGVRALPVLTAHDISLPEQ